MRVLQLTDLHLYADADGGKRGFRTWDSFQRVLEAAISDQRWPPDRLLLTGDLSQDETLESYRRLGSVLRDLDVPLAAIPGNHEHSEALASEVYDLGRPGARVIGDRAWRIVLCDSRCPGEVQGELGAEELRLLGDNLERVDPAPTLVVMHHPPWAVGSAWVDRLGLTDAPALFALLRRHPHVRGVIHGHTHQAVDAEHGNLRQLGAPSTCFQFTPAQKDFAIDDRPPGMRWLELGDDGSLETEVVWVEPALELAAARADDPEAAMTSEHG